MDAHYDPVAALYTFSSCMALEDLSRDGEHKLLVGDLGSGQFDTKLKVYRGTELMYETPLLDLPTGVCTFYMDTTDPRTPAVAVASGAFVYIYKNLRPYFKFTLPLLELNPAEADLWSQVKEDKIDPRILRELLEGLAHEGSEIPLTVRSLKFMRLEADELQIFVSMFKHAPLKRQSVITCLADLKKSHDESDAVSCLVVATENSDVYVLDPEAFTVLAKMSVPAVPVFLSVTGLYDVDYQITVACRDACLYTITSGSVSPKHKIPLGSQPCGLQRIDKNIVVGCMDNSLSCYSVRGKRLWSHQLPDSVTALEVLDYKPRSIRGIIVALRNKEVRLYREHFLVNTLQLDDVVVGVKFGSFGREEGALLMVTQGGALIIKILRRAVTFEVRDPNPGPPKAQPGRLSVPKKTKVFIDQTVRERESAVAMHNHFQRDLYMLRLETSRAFAKTITSALTPLTTSENSCLRIAAEVQGLGPLFRLTVSVQNTSPSQPAMEHSLTFKCDDGLYRLSSSLIRLPLLVPGLTYSFATTVECLDELGRSEPIQVFVCKHGNPIPLLTAVINMPVSESVIVV